MAAHDPATINCRLPFDRRVSDASDQEREAVAKAAGFSLISMIFASEAVVRMEEKEIGNGSKMVAEGAFSTIECAARY